MPGLGSLPRLKQAFTHTHMHTPVEEKPPLRISKATGVYKLSYWQGECGPLSGDGAEKLTLPSVISQERGSGRLQRESRLTSHGVGRLLPVPLLLLLPGYI